MSIAKVSPAGCQNAIKLLCSYKACIGPLWQSSPSHGDYSPLAFIQMKVTFYGYIWTFICNVSEKSAEIANGRIAAARVAN